MQKKRMHTWFSFTQEERRQQKGGHNPNKHMPMLWSVFGRSKEAKVKSGVVAPLNRLALVPQGDKHNASQPPQHTNYI